MFLCCFGRGRRLKEVSVDCIFPPFGLVGLNHVFTVDCLRPVQALDKTRVGWSVDLLLPLGPRVGSGQWTGATHPSSRPIHRPLEAPSRAAGQSGRPPNSAWQAARTHCTSCLDEYLVTWTAGRPGGGGGQ